MALGLFLLAACAPTPTSNVIGYWLAKQTGRLTPVPAAAGTGALSGMVVGENGPVAGAAVVVAERTGQPHVAYTDAEGHYRIEGIPPGQYTPAAVAPGYDEFANTAAFDIPQLVTIRAGETTHAETFHLQPESAPPLPQPWPEAAELTLTATAIVTAPFPSGSQAQIQAYTFAHNGIQVDTLRLYLPLELAPDERLPLLFMVYPTQVDLWQGVSTGFAAQGFALVAISPLAAHGTDIVAHAADARVALALARRNVLSSHIDGSRVVVLGGSFSSAILHRLVRMSGDAINGLVTVGGVSNAFAGAADFYAGKLAVPPPYEYLIPALGLPNLYPLLFLRYSPVYTAAEFPPTLIIHTAADHVIPIRQAYELEAALRQAGVPVEVYYYDDVSHYLQIDENITPSGREMFMRVVEFARRQLRVTTDARRPTIDGHE